jgi:pilus assembly protein FimV
MPSSFNKEKIASAALRYVKARQYEKALKEYQKLLAADPKDERIIQKVADLYQRMGDRPKAVQMYRRLAEMFGANGFHNKSAAVYRQILDLGQEEFDYEIRLKLGEVYQQMGLLSETIKEYAKVVDYFERNGLKRDALMIQRRIIEMDPDNLSLRLRFASALLDEEMYEEGVEEFRSMLDSLQEQNRQEDYLRVLDRYVQHMHDDVGAIHELAQHYLRTGETRRALRRLQVALKNDQENLDTLELLAFAFHQMGQIAKTVTVYKEISRLFKMQNRPQDRIRVLKKMLELNANNQKTKQHLHKLNIN